MSDTAVPAAEAATVSLGVPRETATGERRVSITPSVVAGLVRQGVRIVVEAGAGETAGFPDAAYTEKGAAIGGRDDALRADVVAMVRVLGGDPASPDLARLHAGQVVIGMSNPLGAPEIAQALAGAGVKHFALELVPRTTRAQAMDVLSSQAVVAGYEAVLIAASHLPKMFPLMTTAAGTIPPARVFVMGAGVAGLSAIATARRVGAVVEAYDVRGAVKEEVQSLGARFVELPLETGQDGGSGAYAAELSEDTLRRQRELMTKTVAGSDVVITTAQVQGRAAPVLVTADMVAAMSPGSVIVDLAAEQGGNCELTRAGETVETGGVRVVGPLNVPSAAAHDASLMYAKNVANLLGLIVQKGTLVLDEEDDIVRGTLATKDGAVVHRRVLQALGLEPPPAPPPVAVETKEGSAA